MELPVPTRPWSSTVPPPIHSSPCPFGVAQNAGKATLSPVRWPTCVDNTFVKEDNPNFKAAIALAREGKAPQWSNRFAATKTIAQRLVCINCCERLHGEKYITNGKPSARWDKLQKRSHGCVSKSSTEHILKQVNKQARAGADHLPVVDVKDVFARLEANDAAKKGQDWIEWLGPLCTFHYGCGHCLCFPTKSSSWYRAVKKNQSVKEGLSALGESSG